LYSERNHHVRTCQTASSCVLPSSKVSGFGGKAGRHAPDVSISQLGSARMDPVFESFEVPLPPKTCVPRPRRSISVGRATQLDLREQLTSHLSKHALLLHLGKPNSARGGRSRPWEGSDQTTVAVLRIHPQQRRREHFAASSKRPMGQPASKQPNRDERSIQLQPQQNRARLCCAA
jgi:hypothetical protein